MTRSAAPTGGQKFAERMIFVGPLRPLEPRDGVPPDEPWLEPPC